MKIIKEINDTITGIEPIDYGEKIEAWYNQLVRIYN